LVTLSPENGGTVQAALTLMIGAGTYVMHLDGHSLQPNARYFVNTHFGTCGAGEDITQSQPVGTLAADAAGNGVLERSYARSYPGGGIITIHGYNGSGNELGHISCAELPAA
jgi:hypothetical protein